MIIQTLKNKEGKSSFRAIFRSVGSSLTKDKVLLFNTEDCLKTKAFDLGRIAVGEGSVPVLFFGHNNALLSIKGFFTKNSIDSFVVMRSFPDEPRKTTQIIYLEFLIFCPNLFLEEKVFLEEKENTKILIGTIRGRNEEKRWELLPAFLQRQYKEIPDPYNWNIVYDWRNEKRCKR